MSEAEMPKSVALLKRGFLVAVDAGDRARSRWGPRAGGRGCIRGRVAKSPASKEARRDPGDADLGVAGAAGGRRRKLAVGQRGSAAGLPTRPGGRPTIRSRGLPSGIAFGVLVHFEAQGPYSWGWLPAWKSTVSSSFFAVDAEGSRSRSPPGGGGRAGPPRGRRGRAADEDHPGASPGGPRLSQARWCFLPFGFLPLPLCLCFGLVVRAWPVLLVLVALLPHAAALAGPADPAGALATRGTVR